MLYGVCWYLVTDVSGQPIRPVFKGQAVQEEPNIANNTQPALIRKGNNSEDFQRTGVFM